MRSSSQFDDWTWICPLPLVRLWFVAKYLWEWHKSKSWPQIDGRVEGTAVREWYPRRGWRVFYQVELSYSYELQGRIYSGFYFPLMSSDEHQSKRFISRFHPGRQIIVRHNPHKREKSVMLEEDQRDFARRG